MSRTGITEARVRRLLPALAAHPTGTRIDWMHPDPEAHVDEGEENAHPSSGGPEMELEADRLARVVLAHTAEPGTYDVAAAVEQWGPSVAELLQAAAPGKSPAPRAP